MRGRTTCASRKHIDQHLRRHLPYSSYVEEAGVALNMGDETQQAADVTVRKSLRYGDR